MKHVSDNGRFAMWHEGDRRKFRPGVAVRTLDRRQFLFFQLIFKRVLGRAGGKMATAARKDGGMCGGASCYRTNLTLPDNGVQKTAVVTAGVVLGHRGKK